MIAKPLAEQAQAQGQGQDLDLDPDQARSLLRSHPLHPQAPQARLKLLLAALCHQLQLLRVLPLMDRSLQSG